MREKEQTAHNQQSQQDVSEEKLIEELWAAVSTLPKNCRDVFVLFCFDSCTPDEISEILRVPIGTVRQRLRISREHLSIDLDSAIEQLRNLSVPGGIVQRVIESIWEQSSMPKGNTGRIH